MNIATFSLKQKQTVIKSLHGKNVIACIQCVKHSSNNVKFGEENFKKSKNSFFLFRASMHSSRMRTARLLTVSGGRSLPNPGGVCPTRGVCIRGGGWADPLPLWTEWHTGIKTLPCPKLRLRAVKLCRCITTCRKCFAVTLYLFGDGTDFDTPHYI